MEHDVSNTETLAKTTLQTLPRMELRLSDTPQHALSVPITPATNLSRAGHPAEYGMAIADHDAQLCTKRTIAT